MRQTICMIVSRVSLGVAQLCKPMLVLPNSNIGNVTECVRDLIGVYFHATCSIYLLFVLLLLYNNILQKKIQQEGDDCTTAVEVVNHKGKVKQSITEGRNCKTV